MFNMLLFLLWFTVEFFALYSVFKFMHHAVNMSNCKRLSWRKTSCFGMESVLWWCAVKFQSFSRLATITDLVANLVIHGMLENIAKLLFSLLWSVLIETCSNSCKIVAHLLPNVWGWVQWKHTGVQSQTEHSFMIY